MYPSRLFHLSLLTGTPFDEQPLDEQFPVRILLIGCRGLVRPSEHMLHICSDLHRTLFINVTMKDTMDCDVMIRYC